ncbi:FtsK/SpoIIIE domain-containing protein [Enterococcus casseliflavus]|uniref:FtsK/SpoIIIE domain-containing protein n=2 Tax=Enterococcus TaxID=1350 RepID=UPI0039A65BB7
MKTYYLLKEIIWKKSKDYPVVFVSLENKNVFLEYTKLLQNFRILILIMVAVLIVSSFTFDNAIVILLTWIICITALFKHFLWLNTLKEYFQREFYFEYILLEFIVDNNLYSEKNGLESAVIAYEELSDEIIIYGVKQGDRFTSRLENLETEISALLNLPLTEKIVREGVVEYHFQTVKPNRLHVVSEGEKKYIDGHEIDLGYGVIYNPIKTPHVLIAGGTGSGKSIFISFLILELLKKKSEIFICDPKNADLGSLKAFLGSDRVATTPNNIAKVVRMAVEEMQKRYTYMNASENFKYGSNFANHGFRQSWVIFDEMGAFVATATDKQSKEVVNGVMDGIKQLILLGRQAGVFVLIAGQQMRAENLSSELRDNLGLRIALGANSSEGYRMVMGSAMPETIPPIEVKGAGLLYMQGSGKESAQYYESPYMSPNEFDFISELQLYIDCEERNGSSQEEIV